MYGKAAFGGKLALMQQIGANAESVALAARVWTLRQ
jgi:hypothetical protein